MQSIIDFTKAIEETNIDPIELKKIVFRTLGVTAILRENIHRDPSPGSIAVVKKNIYKAMGAPGDWGYGTAIGDALRRIINS